MTLYHFTECGLDNVWLVNGYNEIDTAYGKAYSVTAADELLREIAIQVARKPGRLTGKSSATCAFICGSRRPRWRRSKASANRT